MRVEDRHNPLAVVLALAFETKGVDVESECRFAESESEVRWVSRLVQTGDQTGNRHHWHPNMPADCAEHAEGKRRGVRVSYSQLARAVNDNVQTPGSREAAEYG